MSEADQVLSIRLRRKNTGTPWGFRMHGGAEYSNPIFIQHVNPKSLSYRHGLRVNDRLLAVGNTPTHSLTHEQVKMEIIRAGNELDFVVQRNMAAAGQDQQDSRPARRVQQPSYPEQPDEEPSDYRSGYTNPKVQSRSFKILQESLNYTEAGEEGISVPSGSTPGEGVVFRAYTEGKRRMQELADINPHNFSDESPIYERGQYLLKCSEDDEAIIAKLKSSSKGEPQVASSKSYTPGEGGDASSQTQGSQSVDLAGSSCLAPAAAQQKYLTQAHAYYGDQNAPTIQTVVHQTGPSAKSAVHQAVHAEAQHGVRLQTSQTAQAQAQQVVQVQAHQAPQVQTQQAPRRRERKRPDRQQQVVVQSIQSPGSVSQSSGFIPNTDMVSSVAEDLNLKYTSSGERVGAPAQPNPPATTKVVVQSAQSGVQMSQTVPQQKVTQQVVHTQQVSTKPVVEAQPAPKQEESTQIQASVPVAASAPVNLKRTDTSSVVVQSSQTTVQTSQSQSVTHASTQQNTQAGQTVQKQVVVTQQEPKPAQIQSEQTVAVQKETVVEAPAKSTTEVVKTGVDSVDATVEPSADVIREYGEKMAETVITESLQDASHIKKDAIDGTCVSKIESTKETLKQEVTPTQQITTPSEPVAAVIETVQKQEPEVRTPEPETNVENGKSELKSTVESSQTVVVSEQVPAKEVANVETSNSVKITEKISTEETVSVDISNNSIVSDKVPAEEIVSVDISNSVVIEEQVPAKEVVNEDSSQSEVVIESVSVAEERPVESSAGVTVEEVGKESINVELTTNETAAESSTISENVEVSLPSAEQSVVTEVHDSVVEVAVSEGVSTEENVDISIGGEEATFTIGGEEESSFVFEVQEGSQDVSAEVQENSFEISIGEDTDETANITLDLSADVTIDTVAQNTEENAEVSFSIDSNETVETVIVEESPKPGVKEEPKKVESKRVEQTESKASVKTETKTDTKTNGAAKKVKIVDSQGGVAARMARFNLKKK